MVHAWVDESDWEFANGTFDDAVGRGVLQSTVHSSAGAEGWIVALARASLRLRESHSTLCVGMGESVCQSLTSRPLDDVEAFRSTRCAVLPTGRPFVEDYIHGIEHEDRRHSSEVTRGHGWATMAMHI